MSYTSNVSSDLEGSMGGGGASSASGNMAWIVYWCKICLREVEGKQYECHSLGVGRVGGHALGLEVTIASEW